MSGRTEVVVTGGAGGLGTETARALASGGARVVLAGRDPGSGEEAAAQLRAATGNPSVDFGFLDLSSLNSVRAFASWYVGTGRPLHVLVNNAGVMAAPLAWTEDGFEVHFGVNHLGHFALTLALLPALRLAAAASGQARVVCLTSSAHHRSDIDFADPNFRLRPYERMRAYGQSKSANALFAVAFSRRFRKEGLTANAVMPGRIRTPLLRHLSHADQADLGWATATGWVSPSQGAATTVWSATSPDLTGRGGLYLEDCRVATAWTAGPKPPVGHYLPRVLDPERAERLWTLSQRLTRGRGRG
ncbi:SDR family NAD(P)-dependent oxidoreductase [Streptomyces sp. T-3]|nr:SDR family NAD(P)-dependent oxidoreductase [Streptomyces sp. T-3]